jgi:hypothetical protein
LENVAIRYVRAVHGGLPNIAEVYDDVLQWLKGESMNLSDTVHGALSLHLAPGAGESEAPYLDGTAKTIPFSDNPGYWDMTGPAQPQLDALEADLALGKVPEFNRMSLM